MVSAMRHIVLAAVLLFAVSCGGPAHSATPAAASRPGATAAPSEGQASPKRNELTGLVAYVGGADPQVYLLDLATGESVQLTHLTAEDAQLTGSGPMRPALTCGFGPSALHWSPDGELLAFAYGGCETVVHVVDADGVSRRIGDGRNPAWSPQGNALVFEQNYPYLGEHGPESWPLLSVDLATDPAEPSILGEAAPGFFASSPSYSPDGTLIALSGPLPEGGNDPMATAAYVMTADGANIQLVARGVIPRGWSPDGRLIVLDPATGRSAALDIGSGASAAIAGGDPVEDVSADGSILASVIAGDRNGVRVYDPQGEVEAEVAGFAPTWKPDATAFLVNDVEAGVLGIFARGGTKLATYRLVAPLGGDYRARWRPTPTAP